MEHIPSIIMAADDFLDIVGILYNLGGGGEQNENIKKSTPKFVFHPQFFFLLCSIFIPKKEAGSRSTGNMFCIQPKKEPTNAVLQMNLIKNIPQLLNIRVQRVRG